MRRAARRDGAALVSGARAGVVSIEDLNQEIDRLCAEIETIDRMAAELEPGFPGDDAQLLQISVERDLLVQRLDAIAAARADHPALLDPELPEDRPPPHPGPDDVAPILPPGAPSDHLALLAAHTVGTKH